MSTFTLNIEGSKLHALEIEHSAGVCTLLVHQSGSMAVLPATLAELMRAALPGRTLEELMGVPGAPLRAPHLPPHLEDTMPPDLEDTALDRDDARRRLLRCLTAQASRFNIAGWVTIEVRGPGNSFVIGQSWESPPGSHARCWPHSRPFGHNDPRLSATELRAPTTPGTWTWRGEVCAGSWCGRWLAGVSRDAFDRDPGATLLRVSSSGSLGALATLAATIGAEYPSVTLRELAAAAQHPIDGQIHAAIREHLDSLARAGGRGAQRFLLALRLAYAQGWRETIHATDESIFEYLAANRLLDRAPQERARRGALHWLARRSPLVTWSSSHRWRVWTIHLEWFGAPSSECLHAIEAPPRRH